MQVFKLFFKILKSQKVTFIMYVAIYIGLIFGVVIPISTKNENKSYIDQKCDYAVLDEDNTDLSLGLTENLSKIHKLVSIPDFEEETIQDELYNRNIGAAIIIKKGFQEAFEKGYGEDYLFIYDIPDNQRAKLFTGDVNEILRYTATYKDASFSIKEAIKRAGEVATKTADVKIASEEQGLRDSGVALFSNYLGWVILGMGICIVAPILIVLDKEDLRKRIECSSFEFSKMNAQIFLAMLVTGAIIVGVFAIAAFIFFGSKFTGITAGLLILNMGCYMTVSLAFAYTISRCAKQIMTINMMGNVIALGSSFLSGVFVPVYLLSDAVVAIAHFLPSFWYLDAIEGTLNYTSDKLPTILQSMGIELLFTIVIASVGLVIARNKRKVA